MSVRIVRRFHRARWLRHRRNVDATSGCQPHRQVARYRAFGARSFTSSVGAFADSFSNRILRSPQSRRAQIEPTSQSTFRAGQHFQSRMFRGRALMTELGTAPAHPVHNVVDYELLFDCVHCGLCLGACPTYIATRAEMDSPRGRIYLMKSLAEGRLELDDDAVRHFDLCLGCRGCETACPSGVHYGRLIEDARAYVEMHHRRTILDRIRRALISAVFPYPNRLRAMLAPLALAERLPLRGAIEAILPKSLREWVELLPPLVQRGQSTALASGNHV